VQYVNFVCENDSNSFVQNKPENINDHLELMLPLHMVNPFLSTAKPLSDCKTSFEKSLNFLLDESAQGETSQMNDNALKLTVSAIFDWISTPQESRCEGVSFGYDDVNDLRRNSENVEDQGVQGQSMLSNLFSISSKFATLLLGDDTPVESNLPPEKSGHKPRCAAIIMHLFLTSIVSYSYVATKLLFTFAIYRITHLTKQRQPVLLM
jgi:hypothetical protein